MAGVIALATAIDWYQCFEQADVENHIRNLVQNAYQRLSQIDDVKVLGYQQDASLLSFIIDGVHHQDLATLLDRQGIAVRAGHHCAHPLMDALGVKGTVRASLPFTTHKKTLTGWSQLSRKPLICFNEK